MTGLLDVGRVVRPHGLRGQVVVELWTNRAERLSAGSRLSGPAGELTVARSSPAAPSGGQARYLVSFEGVSTREAAEQLREAVLRAEAISDESALWIHELVGSDVYDQVGEVIGRVESVEANPASDLLVLEDGRLIPLVFVTAASDGRVTVDTPPGLLDL